MSHTKHTPGPWVFSNNRDYSICVRTESGKEIHIAEYAVTELSEEIDLANARLIAAAPRMLTLLERLLTLDGIDACTKEVIAQAVAEAKGE